MALSLGNDASADGVWRISGKGVDESVEAEPHHMNSTEISVLRVFRRLLDKLKETNADECPRAAGAVHVITLADSPADKRCVAALVGRVVALTAGCRTCSPSAVCYPRAAGRSRHEKRRQMKQIELLYHV
jgi:hypothetical protein